MSTLPHTMIPQSGTIKLVPEGKSALTDLIDPIAALSHSPLDRLLAAEAMQLLIRVDQDLREAGAQLNKDWVRRLMRTRPKVVKRLRRRWAMVSGPRLIALGKLRRHFDSNRRIVQA